jgi:integrase
MEVIPGLSLQGPTDWSDGMAAKISVRKYTGVFYSESTVRKWRERADRIYWVCFKDSKTGKLVWERCGPASEGWTPEAAQKRRHELLNEDRTGDYKPKQERKADQLTFLELMDTHYLPWADENKKRARDDRSLYKNWLKPRFGAKTLRGIYPLDLERLKREMREAGKSEATIRHALCLVRQAFNKAAAWGLWSGDNPCRSVGFPKPNNARQRFLTHDEADLLLAALHKRSAQLARIAKLSLYSGMRLGEIFNLKWGNVDLSRGILYVLDTKNNESRHVFITDRIKEVFDELTPGEPDDMLFTTRQGKSVQWLSKVFSDVVEKTTLNKGISDPRQKITFHSLRHTFASWAVMAGIPLYTVGQALGHKSNVMTARYAHLAPESQRRAFEAVAASKSAADEKAKAETKG